LNKYKIPIKLPKNLLKFLISETTESKLLNKKNKYPRKKISVIIINRSSPISKVVFDPPTTAVL
jgi:hypothetical protein